MLHHLQKFRICEVGHEGPSKPKEVFDEFGAHEPWTKWIIGVVFRICQNEENEAVANAIEYIEACGGYE